MTCKTGPDIAVYILQTYLIGLNSSRITRPDRQEAGNSKMSDFEMIRKILATLSLFAMSTSIYAVPFLQVGAGDGSEWVWDAGSETWITTDGSGSSSLLLTARSGAFEDGTYTGYLVVSAVPSQEGDAFEISFDGLSLSLFQSGYGTPPLDEHPDDMPSHSIYDTYFETYTFTFSTAGEVCNVQPGSETDCTQGWFESVFFSLDSLAAGVTGVHFDLYTAELGDPDGFFRAAPYSHDAQYDVPEPATLALFGLGLIGFGMARRRKS
jgi:hypothetical protein